ncbi:hypothetical protein Slala02_55110 [Streptomyces lavendulae subsp. lavendulae]|nr:hypothetical protein Slala02_55110 [Streptomyces lavendulae subsp. lavendulae]
MVEVWKILPLGRGAPGGFPSGAVMFPPGSRAYAGPASSTVGNRHPRHNGAQAVARGARGCARPPGAPPRVRRAVNRGRPG